MFKTFLINRFKESSPHPLIDRKYRPLYGIRLLREYDSTIHKNHSVFDFDLD